MSIVRKYLSKRAANEKNHLEVLNKEVIPTLGACADAINQGTFEEVFGDGVTTVFSFTHNLATRALFPIVRETSSGLVVTPSSVTFDTDNTCVVQMGSAPAADEMTLALKR